MVLINRDSDSSPLDDAVVSDNTVLVNTHESIRWANANGKSRITEFYGFEGEDFRFFIHSLDSFFALNGITSDSRKVAILKAQLRRVASVFFDNALKERNLTVNKIAYQDAVNILQERFVSEAIIEVYQSAFEEMYQVKGESPSEYLSRLYEAAELGNIATESAIYSRFRVGLLPPIKIFCKEQASSCFKDWIKNANAWWNAHSLKVIKLVDNPFNNEEVNQGKVSDNLSPVAAKRGRGEAQRSKFGDIRKFKEAYVGEESPTMAELSAKLEALDLHPLIPTMGDNGKTDTAILDRSSNSSRSENGALKTFIKNIVCQELSNNGKSNHSIYRKPRNRRRYDVFDNPYTVEPIHPGYESPSDYDYEKFTYDHATKIYDAVLAKEQALKDAAIKGRSNYYSRNNYQPRYRQNYNNARPQYDGNYSSYGSSRNNYSNTNSGYYDRTHRYNGDNSGYHNNADSYNGAFGNSGYKGNTNNHNGKSGYSDFNGNSNNQNGSQSQYNNAQPAGYNGAPNRYQGNGNNYDQGNRYTNNNQYDSAIVEPVQDGQLPPIQKSINHSQPLNALETIDLNAARISKPPEVVKSKPLTKDIKPKKISKTTKPTQKNIKQVTIEDSPMQIESIQPMNTDSNQIAEVGTSNPPVLTQAFAPKLVHKEIAPRIPLSEKISYDIKDLLHKKADIDIGDLLVAVPALKRDLIKAIRERASTKSIDKLPLNYFEDDDIDTTAIYTDFYINDTKVKSMLDTGSAKTCMSRDVAAKLGLSIDASSTSVFTLGNGTKQSSLGIIYDVPLSLGGKLVIPGVIEVLPVCPANLIIGNNWMKRAKAKLNLEERVVKVEYKGTKAQHSFNYTRTPEINTIKAHNVKYHLVQDKENEDVTNEFPAIGDIDVDSTDDASESDEELDDEEIDSDDSANMLMMLEDEYNEQRPDYGRITMKKDPLEPDMLILSTKDHSFYVPPFTTRHYELNLCHLLGSEAICDNYHILCDITNPKIKDLPSSWQPSSSYISQDKKLNCLYFFLVNNTADPIEFLPNEPLARLEIIYEKDVVELNAYQVSSPDKNNFDPLELFSNDSFDGETINLDEYENKVKTKIDISNVPPEVKDGFLTLLYQHDHIFDWDNDKIGTIDIMEHVIKLKPDAVPKRVRPYRLSPLETESLRKELDKLLKLGIIEPAGYSDWSSPLLLVKKADGTYRVVADFRYLNSQSQVMNYPLNNIDDLLDTLSKAYWMSSYDLRSGFFQAKLSEESKPLTTVVSKLGSFSFCRLPQGISSSPMVFSEIMEKCFHELINDCLCLYLDDVTTYTESKDPWDHLNDIRRTFKCMSDHGIVLNPKKCHFFKEEILFLGYIVTRDSIKPNPKTIEKVKNFPLPKTMKEVRSFLGLASYYRRFVHNFARIARPLHEQLQTTKKIPWTDEATKAFNELKLKLTTPPVLLAKPDFDKEFLVLTDASIEGCGAILSQRDDEGREHPIIYSSRALHGAEKNYGISKLELLAVVWALELYRPYLLGSPFKVTVISDHSALPGLLKTKQPTGILARWIEKLSEYDFTIVYRPGRTNQGPDFLSRLGY